MPITEETQHRLIVVVGFILTMIGVTSCIRYVDNPNSKAVTLEACKSTVYVTTELQANEVYMKDINEKIQSCMQRVIESFGEPSRELKVIQ